MSYIQPKQLITLGIFSVIYFFLYFSINAFAVFNPMFIIFLAPIAVMLAAIPFMLFLHKVEQFGLIAMMALLLGVTAVLLGDYPLTIITALVAGTLADFLATTARRRQTPKLNIAAYAIFALWQSGAFLPFLFLRDSILADIQRNFGAQYADNIAAVFQPNSVLAMLVLTMVAGSIGAIFANKLVRKHFVRAGHV